MTGQTFQQSSNFLRTSLKDSQQSCCQVKHFFVHSSGHAHRVSYNFMVMLEQIFRPHSKYHILWCSPFIA